MILSECQTWSLVRQYQNKPTVFEFTALKEIFGPKWGEVREARKILLNTLRTGDANLRF